MDAKRKILVADDDPHVREIVTTILRRAGYPLLVASSGEEALKLFNEHSDQIDLLITDMVMPGLTGDELAAHLRQNKPELKIVFMSGNISYTFQSEIFEAEQATFLSKPFASRELLDAVQQKLNTI
ncbi:MAG: response regulator [Verrucomicrobiota bacterium]|nr:response regulator [Verrucomicrobiota bacterium]